MHINIYPPKHSLDLLTAPIHGLWPQSSALPPVFSPATYAPCCLKPPQGARMAAAIDCGPGGPGQQSLQVDRLVYLFRFWPLLPTSKMRIYLLANSKRLPAGPAEEYFDTCALDSRQELFKLSAPLGQSNLQDLDCLGLGCQVPGHGPEGC